MKYLFSTILGFSLVLGFGLDSFWPTSVEQNEIFADRVNLAMRQVGHQLRTLEGDTESTIPPVEVISSNRFELLIQSAFNYDTLPFLIQNAFRVYDIDLEYQVSVERCDDQVLILGFNQEALENGQVACRGREQVSNCNNIAVTFDKQSTPTGRTMAMVLGGLILVGTLVVGFFFGRKSQNTDASTAPISPNAPEISSVSESIIAIGSFTFDHQNQTLQNDAVKKDLTFRESKLLHQLARHKNEIQSREVLIDEVWADEGVLVGRSLDVFISRLRKILKSDDQVSIKTIHGVGYRLEVAEETDRDLQS